MEQQHRNVPTQSSPARQQAVFESVVDVNADRKVDILLSLMGSFRSQIMAWHDRAYLVATSSFGLLLVIAKQWLDTPNKTPLYLIGYAIAIAFLAWLTQLYLRSVMNAYQGNEAGKLKCEYALRLKDEDTYFRGARFFWVESDPQKERGMPARDIQVLQVAHGIVAGLLVVVCLLVFYF
jgi:hypothetical protein